MPDTSLTVDAWNVRYPVGTPVVAYPFTRDDRGLRTRSRSQAALLGGHMAVGWVEGHSACIALGGDVLPTDGAAEGEERLLTEDTLYAVDTWLDRHDTFAKPYTQAIDGKLTTVGLRIGSGPGRLIARFGDTIVRRPNGTYCLRLIVPPRKPVLRQAATAGLPPPGRRGR